MRATRDAEKCERSHGSQPGTVVGSAAPEHAETAARQQRLTPDKVQQAPPLPDSTLTSGAARGAMWTAAASLAGRAVGLVATLVLTRFLAPEVMGEVVAASLLCFTASWLSDWGFGQYIVLKGGESQSKQFHAVMLSLVLGTVGIALAVVAGEGLARLIEAPGVTAYLPIMALAVWLRRVSGNAERVLVREMKFRAVALAGAAAEVVYAGCAVAFVAVLGMGGAGMAWAQVTLSCVLLLILVGRSGTDWLRPTPLKTAEAREILRFGIPIGVESLFHQASRTWDKLLMSAMFGPRVLGHYNLAFNLAELPAVHVGETAATTLLPTFNRLPPERRGAGLLRTVRLLALVILPLGLGLSAVAMPVVELILPPEWYGVAPFLAVLCAASVFRPFGWVMSVFIQVGGRNWSLMRLEVLKVAVLLGAMALLGRWLGPHAAAYAVGIAFGLHAWLLLGVARTVGGPPVPELRRATRGPFIAGAVMWASVISIESMLSAAPVHRLLVEIPAGAAVYAGVAWLLARDACRDLYGVVVRHDR